MLKISVRDFGPIVEGTVDLKPLTMFVGPSNAGKSYLAMLIYSLMQSVGSPSDPFLGFGGDEPPFMRRRRLGLRLVPSELKVNKESIEAIRSWVQELEPSSLRERRDLEVQFASLPKAAQDAVNDFVKSSLQSVRQGVGRELQRCHGNLADLGRRGPDNPQIQIRLEQDQPQLEFYFREESSTGEVVMTGVEFDISQAQAKLEELPWSLTNYILTRSRTLGSSQEDPEPAHLHLLETISQAALITLFENFPMRSYYLPAVRSGIAQGHKAIASILVRQSSLAALQPLEIPTLSGIITDFISHILTMERGARRRSDPGLEKVVDFLEHEVVQGKVDIEESEGLRYPEISYEPFRGQPAMSKFPFHRTSSMVSELAPVILFLKYLVRPGDLVILEEPESHLHPASQRQMARGIVRLVNQGVKMIITTHSDYFIGQINNLLKLGYASRRKVTREGYSVEDCLKSEDVAAYHFVLDDEEGGSFVKELSIAPDSGIDEAEFSAVSEALYEETVALQGIRVSRP